MNAIINMFTMFVKYILSLDPSLSQSQEVSKAGGYHDLHFPYQGNWRSFVHST